MRLASGKFKHLDSIRRFLGPDIIPAFKVIENTEGILDFQAPFILRSALKDEANLGNLQSGKSLSIGGIDSKQKLDEAWGLLTAQPGLEEVILQQEIRWETHVTLVYEKDFFFAEVKRRQGPPQFIYWTPLAQTLSPEIKILKNFLETLGPYLLKEKFWLMEIGLLNGKLYLFQIHPVTPDLLSTIFSSEMVRQIVFSRLKFAKSHSFMGLLKTEWEARKFRQKIDQKNFHPSLIFLNWEFLFHYFRLFCMTNQNTPDAQSFAKFLALSYQKNWMSGLIKKHLELANIFRKNEAFAEMNVGFETQGYIFIGKGIVEGVVGDEIHVCDQIPLDLIYHKSLRPKAILTKEVGILSHPVLACVENGVYLVLGLGELPLKGERIYLDFDQKKIRIE